MPLNAATSHVRRRSAPSDSFLMSSTVRISVSG